MTCDDMCHLVRQHSSQLILSLHDVLQQARVHHHLNQALKISLFALERDESLQANE